MIRVTRSASLLFVLTCLAVLPFAATRATAQEPTPLGQFGEWEAYTQGSGANRVCYMVSKPQEAVLRSRRGDIFFLVNHWPGRQEFDVVQIDIGYSFKAGSEAEVKIGGETWKLFTRDNNAWTYKPEDDAGLVEALRKGSRMTVTGMSSRSNPTTDQYSLSGSSSAHNAIDKACGR
jgi:hypothetical protein